MQIKLFIYRLSLRILGLFEKKRHDDNNDN